METFEEILDFAMAKEEEAARFYEELASQMEKKPMQEVFLNFAKEEMGHKQKLQRIKQGDRLTFSIKQVQDLKISDYLKDVLPDGTNMSYQEALILAMKREKAAFQLYSSLSEQIEDPALQDIFQGLAQEEAKHKLRFELEYDDHYMD